MLRSVTKSRTGDVSINILRTSFGFLFSRDFWQSQTPSSLLLVFSVIFGKVKHLPDFFWVFRRDFVKSQTSSSLYLGFLFVNSVENKHPTHYFWAFSPVNFGENKHSNHFFWVFSSKHPPPFFCFLFFFRDFLAKSNILLTFFRDFQHGDI